MKIAMTVRTLVSAAVLAAAFPAMSEAAPQPAAATTSPLRRFALVIGSNNGGAGRETLRYAGHDAGTVADVLRQLGGVTQPDMALLTEPDLKALDGAFDSLSKRIAVEKSKGQRVELVVYYSGHADETGILLGGSHYDYAKLRQRIRAVPADVHIAIVDSCASGSFTRMKGGTKLPPFLRDSSNQVEGFAFLSSSSADEAAQESDRIGASFFTYYFVTGLRGAADRNHDGKITLTEAYQYAYEQTLGQTQSTVHGPQHPAYDMHLSGTGDVVITDLRATESALVLPAALKGRVTVVDKSGRVAVEVTKDAGDPLSLALPNETYTVHVDNHKGELVATVTLDKVGEVTFDESSLHKVDREKTVARGDVPAGDGDGDGDGEDNANRNERIEQAIRDSRSSEPSRHREVPISFGGGLRVERPNIQSADRSTNFDALVTLGGTHREVRGAPVIGVAETGEIALGATIGDHVGFAYDMSIGFGPGVFVGDNLQIGATIGFGFNGITGGTVEFGWKVPTEAFVVLELSPEIKPMAYYRSSYIFGSDRRQNQNMSKTLAKWWGDEGEAGAGLRFGGKLEGFVYGSVRELEGERYWGLGIGAVL